MLPRPLLLGFVATLALGPSSCGDPTSNAPADSKAQDTAQTDATSGRPTPDTDTDTGGAAPWPSPPAATPPRTGLEPGDDPEVPLPDPPPLAKSHSEKWPVERYLVAPAGVVFVDGVRRAVEAGTFRMPTEGEVDGLNWRWHTPGPRGELPTLAAMYSSIYAAAEIDVPAGTRLFARADLGVSLFVNNAHEQPGDGDATGTARIPLGTRPGQNLLLFRGAPGRDANTPELELFATPNELVWNVERAEIPDYPVGDESVQYIGVPVLNLREETALDVRARVLESDWFEGTTLTYPGLAGISTTQLAFELRPKRPIDRAGQRIPVRLRIEPLWFDHSYELELEVKTVAASARYKRTRRSRVDGSVQYYGVVPPTGGPRSGLALIVAQHSATLEAVGFAGSYAPKDWAYVITPTNRGPLGFNWEDWGRMDGLEARDHALETFDIDPRRTHLVGHSDTLRFA